MTSTPEFVLAKVAELERLVRLWEQDVTTCNSRRRSYAKGKLTHYRNRLETVRKQWGL